MKLAILCLCLASSASAAPFLHYLPHYGGSRQGPSAQGNNGGYPVPQSQPGMAPISMEIVFPRRFGGGGPSVPGQSFPSQAFIKYSIPQAPGRKSVEIYYPYDFNKRQIMPNMPPMPQLPNIFPFEYPAQNVPQQYNPQTGPQQYNPQTGPQQYNPQTGPQQYNPQTGPQQQYPAETVPQQTPNRVATFDAPPQSQPPSQPVPQDQPVQASQAPAANQ